MKQMPQIHKFMTPMPHTIGADIPIKKALGMMREFNIRHLPVLTDGRMVGIVTDRDVKLAASFQGSDTMNVDEVMTPEPYAVLPEAPVDQVVTEMAAKKYGCAIIQQANGKIVGIFTASDGLRAFGEQLPEFYKHPSGDLEIRSKGV